MRRCEEGWGIELFHCKIYCSRKTARKIAVVSLLMILLFSVVRLVGPIIRTIYLEHTVDLYYELYATDGLPMRDIDLDHYSIVEKKMCIDLPEDATTIRINAWTSEMVTSESYLVWLEDIKDYEAFMKEAFVQCTYEKIGDNLKIGGDLKYDATTNRAVACYKIKAIEGKESMPFRTYLVCFFDNGQGGYKAKVVAAAQWDRMADGMQ